MHDKDEQTSILGAENRNLNERTRSQSAQIAEYEAEHAAFMKEKAMMREDLLRAQAEREDAIALAQDW